MKNSNRLIVIFLYFLLYIPVSCQDLDRWFDEGSMRVDLVWSGTARDGAYALESVRKEPFYSGPVTRLVDDSGYGDHRFEVRDSASGTLIFSRTYCTLFSEWQTTSEAGTLSRAFPHVIRFPWPRSSVRVDILDRDRSGVFHSSWTGMLDPGSAYIDPTLRLPFETADLEINGPVEASVDILFLAEGYKEGEMEKFLSDARRSADFILAEEPFRSDRGRFNVRAVFSASNDSGTDIPEEGIWKNTVMNSSFYTFGIERYMTTPDYRAVCDVAANAHYDQICILVNTDKYGGGGIYNFYSISAADNLESRTVLIHEFGHAFAGLADEYYQSEVAYNDFFNLEVEPWNPNLTTLVDFDSKWESMLDSGTPVPTPAVDSNRQTLGVYEGGGYVAKGVYRPMIDCMMHSHETGFCPVCTRAIEDMILRNTGR
jgi:hypothetical protein